MYYIPWFKWGASPGSDPNASWDKDFNMRNTEREEHINYEQNIHVSIQLLITLNIKLQI